MIGELFALAAMLMFATNVLITKAASTRLDVSAGFVVSVAVNLLFAMLVFAVELVLRRDAFHWDAAGILLFMLAGACSTYLGRWFFFGAIARLGAAKASLFHISSPAFTAIAAWLFLGEALPPVTLVAFIATIVGLFLVSTPPALFRARRTVPDAAAIRPAGSVRWNAWLGSGLAVGLGATLAYSVGNVLRGASVRQWSEPVAGAMLGAAAALALHFLIGSGHAALLRKLAAADRIGLRLYALGGVLTISAQMCMIASMRHVPVALTTIITLCTPLVVIPASYWLMKNQERIGALTLIGAAVTMAGVALIVWR